MDNSASALKMTLLMVLGFATMEMVGCGDNNVGEDDNVGSRTSAITLAPNECPMTTPATDIFITKAGVTITNGTNTQYSDLDFAGYGRPLCYMGVPLSFGLDPMAVQFAPTTVYVSLEGSIGQCGIFPDSPIPIISPDRPMGPLLIATCGPNDSIRGTSTCVLPPLTATDFNSCLR